MKTQIQTATSPSRRPQLVRAIALCSLPVALVAASPYSPFDAAPTLSPAEGHTVRRAFTQTATLEATSVELFQNEETRDMEASLSQSMEEELVVVDEFVTVEEGRVLALRREFTDLSRDLLNTSDGVDYDETEESGLAGETVLFEWDEDEQEWAVSFDDDDSDADEDLLEGLVFDMDMALLLPDEEIAVDDSWTFEGEGLRWLISPGGDLSWVSSEDEASDLDALIDEAGDDMWDNMDGGFTMTYVGPEETDEGRFAVFTIEAELEGAGESLEELEEVDGERFVKDTFVFEGEGEMRWDLDAGRLASATLEGSLGVSRSIGFETETPDGEDFVGGQTITLEGTMTQTMTVETYESSDDE